MKNPRLLLATVALFATGFVTGAVVTRTFAIRELNHVRSQAIAPLPMGQEKRMDYLRKMAADLDLTPPQHSEADQILTRSQERLKAIWEPVAPRVKEEYKRCRKELAEILTPEQRQAFESKHKRSSTVPKQTKEGPKEAEDHKCTEDGVAMPPGKAQE